MEDYNKVTNPIILALIGKQGSGKSYLSKELLAESGMQGVILDPNHEYPTDENIIFHDFKHFRTFLPKVEDSIIIFEEATMFISSFKQLEITQLIVQVRHRRNAIVLIFHSLEDFPPYIERLCSNVILLDINYDIKKLEQSRPKYVPYVTQPKPVYIDLNNM
jgi:ABC-type dipeptide/oligopeptide/nickel transport system ATPase subunit